MKYIYGPVSSWRLGRSLGIDLISGDKHCSFDCIYCQLGNGNSQTLERKIFIPTDQIVKEFESLPKDLEYDYITFSGCGEPTLASNIFDVAGEIKKRSQKPIALLTNSTLFSDPKVRKDIEGIDLIIAKLDASNEKIFQKVNQPVGGVCLSKIIEGIKAARADYPKKVALQIMFTAKNKEDAKNIAELAKEINPEIVYLGTPVRECGEEPLSKEELEKIEVFFNPLLTKSIYSATNTKVKIESISREDVIRRRPNA